MTKCMCLVVGLTIAAALPAQAHSELQLIETTIANPVTVQAEGTQLARAGAYTKSNAAQNKSNANSTHQSHPAAGHTN